MARPSARRQVSEFEGPYPINTLMRADRPRDQLRIAYRHGIDPEHVRRPEDIVAPPIDFGTGGWSGMFWDWPWTVQ